MKHSVIKIVMAAAMVGTLSPNGYGTSSISSCESKGLKVEGAVRSVSRPSEGKQVIAKSWHSLMNEWDIHSGGFSSVGLNKVESDPEPISADVIVSVKNESSGTTTEHTNYRLKKDEQRLVLENFNFNNDLIKKKIGEDSFIASGESALIVFKTTSGPFCQHMIKRVADGL